jgi:NAD(P)-dependent dehydrogenase (short-subunit alcohol dehydrogenase family)
VSIDGSRFVITGGARGIGGDTARVIAERGGVVTIADLLDDVGEANAEHIRSRGGIAHFFHADVSQPDSVQGLMAFASEAMGGIDVLFNNAGINETGAGGLPLGSEESELELMSPELWDRVMGVNVKGSWLCAKYALPHLRRSTSPTIINASSTAGLTAYPSANAYGASKAALIQLTRNLALDLARYRIRVNCYCPSGIVTPLMEDWLSSAPDPEAVRRASVIQNLIPRHGTTAEIAELVCFLADADKSGFINGQAIVIDGGSLAWRGTLPDIGLGDF